MKFEMPDSTTLIKIGMAVAAVLAAALLMRVGYLLAGKGGEKAANSQAQKSNIKFSGSEFPTLEDFSKVENEIKDGTKIPQPPLVDAPGTREGSFVKNKYGEFEFRDARGKNPFQKKNLTFRNPRYIGNGLYAGYYYQGDKVQAFNSNGKVVAWNMAFIGNVTPNGAMLVLNDPEP